MMKRRRRVGARAHKRGIENPPSSIDQIRRSRSIKCFSASQLWWVTRCTRHKLPSSVRAAESVSRLLQTCRDTKLALVPRAERVFRVFVVSCRPRSLARSRAVSRVSFYCGAQRVTIVEVHGCLTTKRWVVSRLAQAEAVPHRAAGCAWAQQ